MPLSAIWNFIYRRYEIHLQPWINENWPRIEPYYELSKSIFFHGIVAFVVASFCLYISAFLFGVVYYYNMPTIYHTYDLNFQYNRRCIQEHRNYLKNEKSSASVYDDSCYPTAFIDFDSPGRKKVLRVDQPYRAYVSLELPESETNLDIGMFMTTMTYGNARSSQAASLRYRPFVLRLATMILYWPFFLFDFMENKQTLDISLFEKIRFEAPSKADIALCRQKFGTKWNMLDAWTEGERGACSHRKAQIQIDYPDIQIYSAHLHLAATFSGLQHFLFQWPVFSFLVGTAIFFVPVLASVLVLFYLILCKPLRPSRLLSGDGNDRVNRRQRRNRRRDPLGEVEPVELPEDEEVGHDEDDSPAPSTASSSIEMIGSPSLDNVSETTVWPDTTPLSHDDDGEGASSEIDGKSESDLLRKRR